MYSAENQISLKELLEIAIKELCVLTTVANPDFRLEQAEFIDSKNEWEIVVSFLVENTNKRLHHISMYLTWNVLITIIFII